MGVCEQSVIEWEGGKTPSVGMWPKVIAFLGYDPSPHPITLGERIKTARRRLGLTLKELAAQLSCYEETVGYWEADAREPADANRQVLDRTSDLEGRKFVVQLIDMTLQISNNADLKLCIRRHDTQVHIPLKGFAFPAFCP